MDKFLKSKRTKKVEKVLENYPLVKFTLFFALIVFGFFLGVNKGNLTLLGSGSSPRSISKDEEVSASELKKLLENEDITLINVHTPYEGEIAGTDTFIEYDSMKANEARLPSDRNTQIVLYCKSGRMSAQALKTLKKMGYKNVRHLKGGMDAWEKAGYELLDLSNLPAQVLPEEGFELPITWSDLAPRLIELGVIDREKFEKAVAMGEEEKVIFEAKKDLPIKINAQNSQFVVDLLWALGLAQKSLVYEEGPMGPTSPEAARGKQNYNEWVGNFASTGGWTLAVGDAMSHYNKHDLIALTPDQHKKVMELASNVYRPCCGNNTAFPDCNHGMAALAAIELMVSKGLSDEEIYKNVLKLNSFWFPQNYLTVATYFARQGTSWDSVDAKLVLGPEYSSGKGAGEIMKKVGPLPYGGQAGGSCGA